MPADSTKTAVQPGPIQVPEDFPIDWQHPSDAATMWFYNRVQFRDIVTPLDFSLRISPMIVGTNRANQAYALPYQADARLINGFAYLTNLPDQSLAPEDLSGQVNAGVDKVIEAAARLQALWENEWLPRVQQHIAFWEECDLPAASLPALLDHLEESIKRVEEMWEIHFLLFVPAMYAISAFEELHQDIFGTSNPFAAQDLLSGFSNKSVEAVQQLWASSRQAQVLSEVRRVLTESAAGSVMGALDETEQGRAFRQRLTDYLRVYGERNELLYLDQPSWREDPTTVIQSLQSYVEQPERDLNAELQEVARRRDRLIAEARDRLADYPQPVVEQFESGLLAAQAANILSEDHYYWIDCRIYCYLRRICVELGARFAALNLIPDAQAVFFLMRDELRELAAGGHTEGLRELIRNRRAVAERFAAITPPMIVGTLTPLPPPQDPLFRAGLKFSGFIPLPPGTENEIRGYPASSGRRKARVKVVLTLAEAHKLKPGDILAAPVTSPAWTPLFATASAVVTDTGGPLCHAAVVAREYAIPAVVGTRIATSILRDGQIIEVDGDLGSIRLA